MAEIKGLWLLARPERAILIRRGAVHGFDADGLWFMIELTLSRVYCLLTCCSCVNLILKVRRDEKTN